VQACDQAFRVIRSPARHSRVRVYFGLNSPLRHVSDQDFPWSGTVFSVYQAAVRSCWSLISCRSPRSDWSAWKMSDQQRSSSLRSTREWGSEAWSTVGREYAVELVGPAAAHFGRLRGVRRSIRARHYAPSWLAPRSAFDWMRMPACCACSHPKSGGPRQCRLSV